MFCPYCASKAYYKHGFVVLKGSKIQRFCCKNCECQFTKSLKKGYSYELKFQAYKMYKEGLGFRAIARVLKVSFETIRRWIKNFAEIIEQSLKQVKVEKECDIVQIDEIFSYIKKNSENASFGLLLIKQNQEFLILKLETDQQKP